MSLTLKLFLFFQISISLIGVCFGQTDTGIVVLDSVKVNVKVAPVNSLTPLQYINQQDFITNNAFNVADAIRNFAGVNIKDYGGIGGLKTVSIRSLGASHTGVTLDGVALGNAQNGQVDLGRFGVDNIQDVSLYNIQVPDICQPAKTYSSASILALKTINSNLKISKPYEVKANFKTGSFGLVNSSLLWQQRINKTWSFSLYNNYQQANGRYKFKVEGDVSDTLAKRVNSDINLIETHANINWAKNDSNKLSLKINNFRSERGLPGAVIFYNSTTEQRFWNKDFFSQATYNRFFNSRLHLILNSKFSKYYTRYFDPIALNLQGNIDNQFTNTEIYNSAAVSYQLTQPLVVSYSADLAVDKLKSNLTTTDFAYPTRYTWYQAITARYIKANLNIQGTLLNTGIHEYLQTGIPAEPKSAYSPTLIASYSMLNNDLILRASYKNIFRNPSFSDLYYTRVGNRQLKPEYATQYSLGTVLTKAISEKIRMVSLSLDGYFNQVKDKIIASPTKDLGTWSMQNLGKVNIAGLDASLKTNIDLTNSNLQISSNYTYQYAVDVTDRTQKSVYLNQIPYTPQHTLSSNAAILIKKWGLNYNYIFSSERFYTSQNLPIYKVPGFAVSDASIVYKSEIQKLPTILSAEVNNLFNTSYSFIRSFPMPGRSIRISINIVI